MYGTRKSYDVVYILGHVGAPAVPSLVQVLRQRTRPGDQETEAIRQRVARALEQIGPPARYAGPALLAIVEDHADDANVRVNAAAALGSIGFAPGRAVPALVRLLEDRRGWGSGTDSAALGALAAFASRHPDSHPCLKGSAGSIRAAQQRMGGGPGFAAIFSRIEAPSPARLAAELDVEEAVIRDALGESAEFWCLSRASEALLRRLSDLRVTRDAMKCRAEPPSPKASPPPPKAMMVEAKFRDLHVDYVYWLSDDLVAAGTSACFGFMPCGTTQFTLTHRNGRWVITSKRRPPISL